MSGGVPLAPLTLETDPNAWDLPSSTVENQNRKSNTCTMNALLHVFCTQKVNVRLIV